MVEIEALTPDVAAEMAPFLRRVDRVELACATRGDPAAALAAMASRARRGVVARLDGRPVCMFGVSAPTLLSRVGCPWMLATNELSRPDARRAFLRGSRGALAWLTADYDRLWNIVWERNRQAIRWLSWLGFRFDGRAVDLRGRRFLHFGMEVSHVR